MQVIFLPVLNSKEMKNDIARPRNRKRAPLDQLPTSLILKLESKLNMAVLFADDDGEEEEGRESKIVQNIIISEAFTKFFLNLIGDFTRFVYFRDGAASFHVLLST